jgi:catechol 2,3-dioxygenase-like lactoylglutathione lyase family enzyme
MDISSAHPIRIARPSRDLRSAERFWVEGAGLQVLWRSDEPVDADEHALLMVGAPGATWHLELLSDPEATDASHPSEEDLLVLYLGEPPPAHLVQRLVDHGGRLVRARNPYWDRWGVTVVDPDGYRLVLCSRTWDQL